MGIIRYILLACSVLLLVSCWREDLSNCWKDDLQITLVAEKFQATDNETEAVMADKIDFYDYYLYRVEDDDMVIVKKGRVAKSEFQGGSHQLNFVELPFGKYKLAAVANRENAGIGDDLLNVSFNNENQRNDFFVAAGDFSMNCYCEHSYDLTLYNTQGELEIRLKDLPANIVGAKIQVTNLYEKCGVDLKYSDRTSCENYVEAVTVDGENMIVADLWMFPTVINEKSQVTMTLFMDVYLENAVVATAYTLESAVIRNNTIRIAKDFKGELLGQPEFNITINPTWDDVEGDSNVDV